MKRFFAIVAFAGFFGMAPMTNATVLALGDNSVSDSFGPISCDPVTGCFTPYDRSFDFSLPSGFEITSITADFSRYAATNSTLEFSTLAATTLPISFSDFITTTGVLTAFSGTAAGPGVIDLEMKETLSGAPFSATNFAYTIHIEVASTSAAPEPATLALLGFGLAGVAFARRKRT